MSTYPIRQRRPDPIPPAREFMRRCAQCTADFMALAPGKTGERGLWLQERWYCSEECAPRDAQYGYCQVCGAPRAMVQQDRDGEVSMLVCTTDESHR